MPMEKYVNGIWFEGVEVADKWVIRTWEANGVMERSAAPYVMWRELHDFGFKRDGWTPIRAVDPVEDAELIEERRVKALASAAKRAKTMCRRVIITEGFNELLTLTYRDNQEDRALCKKHFEEWVRRMKRALGGNFRYCAAFERQERGAMHVHLATHKLPKHVKYKGVKIEAWKLGTRVWRSIVGDDNGLCFVGGMKRGKRHRKWSLARMAAYVSKYIMKDFEDAPAESNRYSRSNGVQIGEIHTMEVECTYAELIGLCFEHGEGDTTIALRANRFNDRLWFCKEAAPLAQLSH
ncbi:rolling circle replication-associated protein [Variovorax sp. RB2P76]|uniref:rolling circle replication-associated protein n=1 Tax=Variovorax sp. RB2P76 TaxID=3443736 RepID=UPI003F44F920